jgi:hypothetical protein
MSHSKSFVVTVLTIDGQTHTLNALAECSCDLVVSALEVFGDAKVTVKPAAAI